MTRPVSASVDAVLAPDAEAPLKQSDAPLVDALRAHLRENTVAFSPPGHGAGRAAPRDVAKLLGRQVFKADVITLQGLDDRRERHRVRERAERLAAELWGADHCFFSTNGSSLSNHAVTAAVARPGETVLVARNSHKSLIGSLIITGVRPVWLEADYDPEWDVHQSVSAAELARKLDAHPDAKAVFVTSPTYYGVTSDIGALAREAHGRGVPLVVDEAWGAHFPFHPKLPQTAVREGADLVVTSIHKTMTGLEPASIMLLRGELVSAERLERAYDLFESTSAPGVLLTSIDAARRQFARHGKHILDGALRQARRARGAFGRIDGLRVLGPEVATGGSRAALDETKVLFDVNGLGVTGYEAEDWLIAERKISLALNDERRLMAVFGPGATAASTGRLIRAVRDLAKWARAGGARRGAWSGRPSHADLGGEFVMTPAEAFYAPCEATPLCRAAGRVAAEMVSPYPPGVPRLVPGQRITEADVAFLRRGMPLGLFPMDATDQGLATVRVVA